MDTFTALSVPIRRNIIELLAKHGKLSATEISSNFDVTSSAISQHLKVLREADLVRVERRAQQRIYDLNPDVLRNMARWAEQMSARLDRLDAVIQEEKQKRNRR